VELPFKPEKGASSIKPFGKPKKKNNKKKKSELRRKATK